ncbi:hypothetical protein FRC07_011840, partial [Ceratobasidium sp. 392]
MAETTTTAPATTTTQPAVASTPAAPPLPPRSADGTGRVSTERADAGPSKPTPVDDDIEDPTPAPRYSMGSKPPVLDLKKKGSDAETKADSGVVVSSPSSIKSPKGPAGTFGLGAGTSGPAPPKGENAELHTRAATAESALSTSAVQKITAAERTLNGESKIVKDAKRVSKILKNEQKAEDRSMKAHIKELDKLSAVQRQAAKDEAAAITAQRKAVKEEHKLNMKYLAAKAAWEKAAADLKSKNEMLDSTKEHARIQTELLQKKTKEMDQLRTQKATDDRERRAKLLALKNPSGRGMTGGANGTWTPQRTRTNSKNIYKGRGSRGRKMGNILVTAWKWIMLVTTDASLPNMRLGGAQVDEGQNALMIQFFEWDAKAEGVSWWKHFENEIPRLKELGVTQVWLPPPHKAMRPKGQGYDAYDLWDLGEFHQKGT